MNDVHRLNAKRYFLPGKTLIADPGTIVTHTYRVDAFIKYNLATRGYFLGGRRGVGVVIDRLRRSLIGGRHMEGTTIGVSDTPVWVAPVDDLATIAPYSASRLRDFLGMSHVASGHLVEMRYAVRSLLPAGIELRADRP